MILSGIAVIPWQLGKLIRVLFESSVKEKFGCSKCGHDTHDKDASHCKKCGNKLKRKSMTKEEG